MMRILLRRGDGSMDESLDAGGIRDALADPRCLLWVDFLDEPDEECGRILRDVFRFHPLAIDDALMESHVPKVDDWSTYLYIVLHALSFDPAAAEMLRTRELDVFAGDRYIVTHREHPLDALDRVWDESRRDGRSMAKGSVRLLYHLIDEIVASHLPVVDALEEEMERIEEALLSSPGPEALPQVLHIKRALMHLRRILAPQREVLSKLARDELALIAPDQRPYFRDVYDHLLRLHEIAEGLRDLASGALETYLSVINNRMNEVMKTFTLITTLFMPISFLTGFFGMNFFSPSDPPAAWTGRIAFIGLCAGVALVPVLMFLWLRRKRWI
jgi:magnesium transporter